MDDRWPSAQIEGAIGDASFHTVAPQSSSGEAPHYGQGSSFLARQVQGFPGQGKKLDLSLPSR